MRVSRKGSFFQKNQTMYISKNKTRLSSSKIINNCLSKTNNKHLNLNNPNKKIQLQIKQKNKIKSKIPRNCCNLEY